MIIVTGAAGFIGSCFVKKLNDEGFKDLVLVDDFSVESKIANLSTSEFHIKIDRAVFIPWLKKNTNTVQAIVHIGARTDTAEFDVDLLNKLNTEYTKELWRISVAEGLPFLYASSAATYGLGEVGFDDNESTMNDLKPLNPYGQSKLDFDIWALKQEEKPRFWAGFKFFNVYGPNEYHKGRMASVILHAYNQISEKASLKLFQSHNKDYENGEQLRDFVYVKDVVDVLYYFLTNRKNSGIYNLGTGKAESFNTLGKAVFTALNKDLDIGYIPTPIDIRDKYQYYTCANIEKLRKAGYQRVFYDLHNGTIDYVKNYLAKNAYF
jgi:ADP-L-glycero-D-manno-heptose 6-epimerase